MEADKIYKFFADYVFKKSGIVYRETEYYRLEARLTALADHFGKESLQEIYEMYQSPINKDMHSFLINICTNNETYFMRDMLPFKVFATAALAELNATFPTGDLEMWSCACSRGQEPYSALMSADTFSKQIGSRLKLKATDISSEMVEISSKAHYTILEVQRGLPAPFLVKYLEKVDDSIWKIKSSLRSKVSFSEFNLLTDRYPSNRYHIIFCRNVLIYQNVENREQILHKLYSALKPGGILLLGAGESMIGIKTDFVLHKLNGAVFYLKE